MEKFGIHGYPTSSWKKSGDVLANRPVKLDAANEWRVVVATAVTDTVIGFTTSEVDSLENGDTVGVAMRGVVRAIAGGAISVGAYLTPTTDGKLIATTTGTDLVCAVALSSASADLDEVEVMIIESKTYDAVS